MTSVWVVCERPTHREDIFSERPFEADDFGNWREIDIHAMLRVKPHGAWYISRRRYVFVTRILFGFYLYANLKNLKVRKCLFPQLKMFLIHLIFIQTYNTCINILK